jgi:hypothetical protein
VNRAVAVIARGVAIAALTLAGCAGSGSPARQFRASATRICASATAQTARIPAPATPAGAETFLRRGVKLLSRELTQLRRLKPPRDLAPSDATALSGSAAELTALRSAISALDRGADPLTTVPALQHRLRPIEARADGAWHALGVPACQSR